jgi:hypothetical protein
VVVKGDVYPRFRVQFMDHFSRRLLEAFARIAESGDFGRIHAFEGVGRDCDGKEYAFRWARGGPLAIGPGCANGRAGHVLLRGRLDFETINRIRNFPLFHLRARLRHWE